MIITFENFQTILSKQVQKLALKNEVREIDEIEKNKFVAFVDEGDNSFDVSITINDTKELIEHTCDCRLTDDFCRHKTALLVHIVEKKKVKKTIKGKAKSKISTSETLLAEISLVDLKEWVRDLLHKNPDLDLIFSHHFTYKNESIGIDEIPKLINNVIKSMVGRKRNIDSFEIRKIIGLWSELENPVLLHFKSAPHDLSMFQYVEVFIKNCFEAQIKFNCSSQPFEDYIERFLSKLIPIIQSIDSENDWIASVTYFVSRITDESLILTNSYLKFLCKLAEESDTKSKLYLVNEIILKYIKLNKQDWFRHDLPLITTIFNLGVSVDLFEKYFKEFKPIRWNNKYNHDLIEQLISIKQYSLAETYCKQEINANINQEYNLEYWQYLKYIYQVTNHKAGMIELLKAHLPFTFNFEDYLYIIHNSNDSPVQHNEYRNLILSKARNSSRNRNVKAQEFCFRLVQYEQNYLKLIEYIDEYALYSVILNYLDSMLDFDKLKTLKKLMMKEDSIFAEEKSLFKTLEQIFLKIQSYFTQEAILEIIKDSEKKWSRGKFKAFIIEKLVYK